MRILLTCLFVFIGASASLVLPQVANYSVFTQEQSRIDDGPHVLWEGKKASVHWVRDGVHTVEIFNAPFELLLGEPVSGKLRLNGRQYADAEFELKEPPRIFVISDVHGVFDVMRDLLATNGVINAQNRWTFGKGHLIILGDIADRGKQVTQSYWFVRALEESARAAGGRVHMILGNHEVMVLSGNFRDVNQMYMAQIDGMPSLEQLYGTRSELGRWLCSRPLMLKLGDTLFLHGGVSPEFVKRGLSIADANRGLRITATQDRDEVNIFLQGSSGPLWYRGMVLDKQPDSISETDLSRVLKHFCVKRVVVGHTTMDMITSLHNGKVIAVDAGIQHRRGEGLYVEGDKAYRALPDGSKAEIVW